MGTIEYTKVFYDGTKKTFSFQPFYIYFQVKISNNISARFVIDNLSAGYIWVQKESVAGILIYSWSEGIYKADPDLPNLGQEMKGY